MSNINSILVSSKNEITFSRIAELVANGGTESLVHEFKERYTVRIIDTICAMINSYGGIIVLGVADTGTDRIVGVADGELEKVVDACHGTLEPPYEPEIIQLNDLASSKKLVVLRVTPQPHLMPMSNKGTVMVRRFGQNVKATQQQIVDLVLRRQSATPFHRSQVNPPSFSNLVNGERYEDLIIRSGMSLPINEAASLRSLSEDSINGVIQFLNNSEVHSTLIEWLERLATPGHNPFQRRGLNRSRRCRLEFWSGGASDEHSSVTSVVMIELPDPIQSSTIFLNFTIEIRIRIRGPIDEHHRFANAKVPQDLLRDTFASMIGIMVDQRFRDALADFSELDPVSIPMPFMFHIATNAEMGDTIHFDGSQKIPNSGISHGARLIVDSALDLETYEGRFAQANAWVDQTRADAGLAKEW